MLSELLLFPQAWLHQQDTSSLRDDAECWPRGRQGGMQKVTACARADAHVQKCCWTSPTHSDYTAHKCLPQPSSLLLPHSCALLCLLGALLCGFGDKDAREHTVVTVHKQWEEMEKYINPVPAHRFIIHLLVLGIFLHAPMPGFTSIHRPQLSSKKIIIAQHSCSY